MLHNETEGPYTPEEMRAMWTAGKIDSNTPLATGGSDEWKPLGFLNEHIFPTDLERDISQSSQSRPVLGDFSVGVMIDGVLVTLVFLFLFETTVEGAGAIERVQNIGLLNTKQNGVICGIGLALFGGILMIVDRLNKLLEKKE